MAPNDYGQPENPTIPVIAAGDCRMVLGRHGARKDGARAAGRVLAQLGIPRADLAKPKLDGDEVAQRRLAMIFANDGADRLKHLPGDTIICRCEGRTRADLSAALANDGTARTLRLLGRFGMGPCQGRFCLGWVAAIARSSGQRPGTQGNRWPVRPVSVADMLKAADHCTPQTTPFRRI